MPQNARDAGIKRRTRSLSPDKLRMRRAELQAELERIEAQDKERYAAIGRAVEKEAENDPTFAKQLRGMLERNVTDRAERVCLGLATARRGRGSRAASDTG